MLYLFRCCLRLIHVCVQTIFISIHGVPPYGKELFTRLTVWSPYDLSNLFILLVISHFGFEDRILVLIVPVPGQCLSINLNGLKP